MLASEKNNISLDDDAFLKSSSQVSWTLEIFYVNISAHSDSFFFFCWLDDRGFLFPLETFVLSQLNIKLSFFKYLHQKESCNTNCFIILYLS